MLRDYLQDYEFVEILADVIVQEYMPEPELTDVLRDVPELRHNLIIAAADEVPENCPFSRQEIELELMHDAELFDGIFEDAKQVIDEEWSEDDEDEDNWEWEEDDEEW